MAPRKFTLVDFKNQMEQIKRMGSIRDILKTIPGMSKFADSLGDDINPEADMAQIEGIINSMTLAERENPDLIERSRRHRIARGSGVDPTEVNKLITDFDAVTGLMTQIKRHRWG